MSMALVYLLSLLLAFVHFFTFNASQTKNKKTVNEKQDQPPKRCPMLQNMQY